MFAEYLHACDNLETSPWVDYERGGVALRDASQGLDVKDWKLRFVSPEVRISADGVAETVLFSEAGITEVSLAFDQNMNPVVAYVQTGTAKIRWYDSLAEAQVISTLPAGSVSPRLSLDDKRALQSGTSDVILAYVRDDALYFRAQRDRFEVEYLLKEAVGGLLVRIGMNTIGRLQFLMESTTYSSPAAL
jgi:hypothetical protein